MPEDGGEELVVAYKCPRCGHRWHTVWDCACDDDCPECGLRHITALKYKGVDDKKWTPA